ncbi:hypothetical protein CHELA1G11_13004 [Hyphomicrobiales bacterium]|nr:hypothetical protein CHELA1G2_11306 [Hyphomicrobiales bacterium]CAH1668634.1 hypothetical protein CHELA1G11_13004 [Hyphomicrobiales bacterium]
MRRPSPCLAVECRQPSYQCTWDSNPTSQHQAYDQPVVLFGTRTELFQRPATRFALMESLTTKSASRERCNPSDGR